MVANGSAPLALAAHLARWNRRWRAAQGLRWGPRGLAAGLMVVLVLAVAARIWPLVSPAHLLILSAVSGLLGLLGSLFFVWLWPRSTLAQARFFDRRLGLKERVSTAVEIHRNLLPLPPWLAQQQLEDALRAANRADPVGAIPLRPSLRDWLPVLLCLALLAGAIWLPNPMEEILAERAAVRQAVQEQVEELEALRDEIEADPQLSEESQQELLEILDGAIEKLERGDLTREEALAELSENAERLRELDRADASQKAAGLQSVAELLGDSALTSALAQALASGDFQLAAEFLEDLADDLGELLTREQELDLAEQLAQAAAALAESNPGLAEQLAQAAEAIQNGDIAAARQALSQASQTMGQTGQQIAASQAARNAAQQLAQSGQQIARAGSNSAQSGGLAEQNGSSAQAGQDGQGGGAGRGEGNSEGTGGQAGPMETDNAPGDGGLREFEPIFAPQRLGGEGGPEMELPQGGDPGELLRELPANPEIGESTVPYNQVYADYADAANQALQDQHIPLGLRTFVRDYFSSLEP